MRRSTDTVLRVSERIVVNVDGGARGNPGPAAIAAVASDEKGQVLAERSETIGEATNNVAEYRALLLGIELAHELGAEHVELVGDSKLIVEQVRGNWKVKQAHLRPLNEEAKEKLAELGSWSIRHVKRGENERADELLNEALDAA
jgi:ribonuclease HI